jgi:hypothetical protein
MTDWHWQKRVTAQQKRRIARFFGHLKIRYTRNRIYTELKDYRDVGEYRVIGRDSGSVAIMSWESLADEEVITHIHFEGDRYWIHIPMLGGNAREWFRRVQQ